MASTFRQPKAGGGCCGCAEQTTPCGGCADCHGTIPVQIQTRAHYAAASKCGLRHPFRDTMPPRFFREVHVQCSTKWEVLDTRISDTAFEPGGYRSRCLIEVRFVEACVDNEVAGVTLSASYETNNWSGRPAVALGELFSEVTEAFGVTGEPYDSVAPFGNIFQCWGANEFFDRDVGSLVPSRTGGRGDVVTANYDAPYSPVSELRIPAPSLVSAGPGFEVWGRVNDSLAAESGGWGYTFGGIITATYLGDTVQILASREASGFCNVTLSAEFTTEQLKQEARANEVVGEWVDAEDCAREELTTDEQSYVYKWVEFRFVYNYALPVKIGFKLFPAGEGDDAEVQYVESPGEHVYALFPAGLGDERCVNFVEAIGCP